MLIFALTNTVHVKSCHAVRKSYSHLPRGTFCTRLQTQQNKLFRLMGDQDLFLITTFTIHN